MSTASMRCLLVLALAPAALFIAHGSSASAADPAADAAATLTGPAPASTAAVIRVYRSSCLKCHDTDGTGEIIRDVMSKIPDFTDASWHATRSDEDLCRSILEGKGKSMPSMRRKLGPVDVGEMVRFVRAFRGGKQVVEEEPEEPDEAQPSPEPTPANAPGSPPVEPTQTSQKDLGLREGSLAFQRSCAACHGMDGRGVEMRGNFPEIPDFTARAWQETRTDPRLIVSVLDGKGTGMPPFRDKLSREQARDLVAFVRSLGPSTMRATRPPPDDFEARFRQLLAEFEDLRRRSRALAAEPASPRPVELDPTAASSPRQAQRDAAQSRGAGSRDAGG